MAIHKKARPALHSRAELLRRLLHDRFRELSNVFLTLIEIMVREVENKIHIIRLPAAVAGVILVILALFG